MPTVTPSNYANIELAVANLITNNLGIETSAGDFMKVQDATPLAVIRHGSYRGPLTDRMPNFERIEWTLCIDLVFDYTSDADAHNLMRLYRQQLLDLFLAHRPLDDGNTPYPTGLRGQCLDSKLVSGTKPMYIEIGGKDFVMVEYELWAVEQLTVVYAN